MYDNKQLVNCEYVYFNIKCSQIFFVVMVVLAKTVNICLSGWQNKVLVATTTKSDKEKAGKYCARNANMQMRLKKKSQKINK